MKTNLYPSVARPFVSINLSSYSKYISPNVSRVDTIPNPMSFRHKPILYGWFFGKFIVSYESAF